jgi:predicted ATP-dependent endonuclease of OLD family
MTIRKLSIRNSRGIKKGDIEFGRRNLLIGLNNVGKSSVLATLNYLFGGEGSFNPADLDIYDFHGAEAAEGPGAGEGDWGSRQGCIHPEAVLTNFNDQERKAIFESDAFHGGVLRYWNEDNSTLVDADSTGPTTLCSLHDHCHVSRGQDVLVQDHN